MQIFVLCRRVCFPFPRRHTHSLTMLAMQLTHITSVYSRMHLCLAVTQACPCSGVASPKIWGVKMFDFRPIILFCLEKRLSKHKMTVFSKNLGYAYAVVCNVLSAVHYNTRCYGESRCIELNAYVGLWQLFGQVVVDTLEQSATLPSTSYQQKFTNAAASDRRDECRRVVNGPHFEARTRSTYVFEVRFRPEGRIYRVG